MTLKPRIRKDKAKKNGEVPISIVYTAYNEETYFSTGRTILPKFWNKDAANQWVNSDYGDGRDAFNRTIKKKIGELQEKVDKFYLEHGADPTCAQLKGKQKGEETKSFFPLFKEYIRHQSSQKGVKSVAKGTTENYEKAYRRFESYQTHIGHPFDFHSITHGFYDDFVNYLTKEFNNSTNTITTYIKILKAFLHWAEIYHGIKIDAAVMKNMSLKTEQNAFVYLHNEEIELLRKVNLSDRPILEQTRDAFVLQCYIGCRHGDIAKMISANVRNVGGQYRLMFKTHKNKMNIDIPLVAQAVTIIEKYKDQNPSDWVPPLGKFNIYIKEVARLAGLLDTVQIVRGGGIFRKEQVFQKWQLITSHTAPRTFINIMLAAGVPEHRICAIVGKSQRTLEKYKHVTNSDIERAFLVFDQPKRNDSPEPQSPTGEPRE